MDLHIQMAPVVKYVALAPAVELLLHICRPRTRRSSSHSLSWRRPRRHHSCRSWILSRFLKKQFQGTQTSERWVVAEIVTPLHRPHRLSRHPFGKLLMLWTCNPHTKHLLPWSSSRLQHRPLRAAPGAIVKAACDDKLVEIHETQQVRKSSHVAAHAHVVEHVAPAEVQGLFAD